MDLMVCYVQCVSCMTILKMAKSAPLTETATNQVNILAIGTRFARKPSNSRQLLFNKPSLFVARFPFQLVLVFFVLDSAPDHVRYWRWNKERGERNRMPSSSDDQ